jgi:hypothetical protein
MIDAMRANRRDGHSGRDGGDNWRTTDNLPDDQGLAVRQVRTRGGFKIAALQVEGESQMIDVIFPKRVPTARERETRPIPSDYRPRQLRAVGSNGAEGDGYPGDEPGGVLDGIGMGIDLERLEDELSRNRLNEIWKIRPEGAIDQNSLPTMLHLWSISGSESEGREAGRPTARRSSSEPSFVLPPGLSADREI